MKNKCFWGLLVFVLGIGIIGCGGDDETRYSVTFNSNGGSSVITITGIVSGSTIILPENPIKTGYYFLGWFNDNETFLDEFTSSTVINTNLTVYAKWLDQNYIGTFAGIEVWVAEGVDRSYGEDAFNRLIVTDVNDGAGFPDGGRVAYVSGGVISKIIIIGVLEGTIWVSHIGGGVLEARFNQTATGGGMHGILFSGRFDIDNNIIGE